MASRPMPPLPRLLSADQASVLSWANQLVGALERQIAAMNAPGGAGKWSVTGLTASRSLNAGTATLVQTAEALGTLITDLQSCGNID